MPPIFVSTESLENQLGSSGLVIVDVRPKVDFLAGHIPGAVQTEWRAFADPDSNIKGLLHPDTGLLEKLVGELGIGNNDEVIVYTDPFDSWGSDGRIYWMLSYLGHESVKVLDGGWVKWKRENKKTELGFSRPVVKKFKVALKPELVIFKHEMKMLIDSRMKDKSMTSSAVIDARSLEEYNGAMGPGIPRGGHVPSAINIPWDSFFNEDASIKSMEEIQQILEKHDLRKDQEIICYCTGGVRSAWLLAILHSVGYGQVKNYTGSWWEWSKDDTLPIEI